MSPPRRSKTFTEDSPVVLSTTLDDSTPPLPPAPPPCPPEKDKNPQTCPPERSSSAYCKKRIVSCGTAKVRLQNIAAAIRKLPFTDEYILSLFSSTTAFLIGLPDTGSFPPDIRRAIINATLLHYHRPFFIEGVADFADSNKLEMSIERLHQFCAVLAVCSAITEVAGINPPLDEQAAMT